MPEEMVTISRKEYDRIKTDISSLYSAHNLIREMIPVVNGEDIGDFELQSLRISLVHFEYRFLR